MAKKMIPISRAAEILGVSPSTVRNWTDEGLLRSVRAPGKARAHRRYEEDTVLAFAASMGITPDEVGGLMDRTDNDEPREG